MFKTAAKPTEASHNEAMQAAFLRFHRPIHAFIRKHTRDDELAKDLTQDVFVKAHVSLGSLVQQERLESWLYRIARNTITDHFKRKRPDASLPDLVAEEDAIPRLVEYEGCLPEMIAELNANYREALELSMLSELSQQQVADRLGLSYTGAKSRIQRARAQLEGLFQERCNYTADLYGNVIDDACDDACGCTGAEAAKQGSEHGEAEA